MAKWNYPPEYLKKDGKLKKNCLKKAAEWRKNHPPKFLQESTFNKQMTSRTKLQDEILESIPYPSYQHMNQDIINIFTEMCIGNVTNDGMNTVEECELFRAFCIMNKRLCLLDKEFRKNNNIKEKIEKCKLIYKTEIISKQFKIMPTNDWLPFNKVVSYNQKKDVINYIKSNYGSFIPHNYMTESPYIIETTHLINTIESLKDNILVKESLKECDVYSFIDLIKFFKEFHVIYHDFIITLRKNYCKKLGYYENINIELNIQYFINTLMY